MPQGHLFLVRRCKRGYGLTLTEVVCMRHTQEEWKEIVKEFKDSGLSQRKWCKINGEDRNRLQYWLLRFEYLSLGTDVSFAEIVTGGECCGAEASE